MSKKIEEYTREEMASTLENLRHDLSEAVREDLTSASVWAEDVELAIAAIEALGVK